MKLEMTGNWTGKTIMTIDSTKGHPKFIKNIVQHKLQLMALIEVNTKSVIEVNNSWEIQITM
jgi:hypothetical protein